MGVALGQEAHSLKRQDQQDVPVTAYKPLTAKCQGVAIISPGAGGSEQGYRYLGEALSVWGYWAVVVGHQDSGRNALREQVRSHGLRQGLAQLIAEPQAYNSRLMDIAAAQQWAQSQCAGGLSVLIGHSMGAATTMIEAGARNKLGVQGSHGFAAYIALSPQGVGTVFAPDAWSGIAQPVLSITGTRDQELGGASWRTRTEPYHNMPAGCKWLGVIDGATHMNFAGHGASAQTQALTTRIINAFLDGIERGDCKLAQPIQGMALDTK